MKIGLMAVDSRHFNFALAKIAAYHKAQSDSVEWYDPMFGEYDRLYMSKLFNFTSDYQGTLSNAYEVFKGGTGYSLTTVLPDEIERCLPDYSIYPDVDGRTSYGFLTRGCPNSCKWCVVPRKEGKVRPYADIDDVTENGRRPYAVLMDNNILACDYGLKQIEKIIDRKYHVDFNQALDARLVTPEIAKMLARVKWIGSIVRFGCDTPKQIEECQRVIDMMQGYGYGGQYLLYTMINSDLEESHARLDYWRSNKKCRVVAQPFRDPNKPNEIPKWQSDLARWAMRREIYATCSFKDFSPRKGFVCGEYFKIKR